MRFTWSNALYIVPPLAAAFLVWWFRRKGYVGYSLAGSAIPAGSSWTWEILIPRLFDAVGLVGIIIALLNPVVPTSDHTVASRGLNIALVVDLSSSMEMPVTGGKKSPRGREETRLDAVKSAIIDFIHRRKGDRLGLVVFSSNAYVVTPLTLDYAYLENYVRQINDRTLSDEGMTAIGEGLWTARSMLRRDTKEQSRRGNVIVLMTDGENNTGRTPDSALREVRMESIRTYFIGVEVVLGTTVENQGFNEAAKLIAGVESTGGRYFDARNAAQLRQAYQDIDHIEKVKFQTRERFYNRPVFSGFALAALGAFGCGQLLRTWSRFRELS